MQGREHDPVIVASIWLGGLHASRAMKAKKRKPVLRHCAHCGQPFAVDPRVGKLHRYCSAPASAKASLVRNACIQQDYYGVELTKKGMR